MCRVEKMQIFKVLEGGGGNPGACSREKVLESLVCLRLHSACFHSNESGEKNKE